jgi:two-component sensor histidine kinase
MKKTEETNIAKLREEITRLKKENERLLKKVKNFDTGETVKVPAPFKPIFDEAQKTVGKYFESLKLSPSKGSIDINGERYILVRASALSLEFLNSFKTLYSDRGEEEAMNIGKNILFDLSHVLGIEDAHNFHKKMNLKDPISKLSAGPVHFAYSGWAFVDISKSSNPFPDENYYIKYDHPYSFEADSWIKAGKRSKAPVCIMNAGYSSGWCEASFGISLTSVEISCRARGDKTCTFIMAPPHKIEEYLKQDKTFLRKKEISVPAFLERKKIEEQVKSSLQEKEVLLKEIHHRVKNNLQIISSLLNLQAEKIEEPEAREKYVESIGRIKSMAIIHELLYRSKNLSTIKIRDYFNELTSFISQTYRLKGNIKVELKFDILKESIDISKAIPCGIILNEILSNAFKYAFPDNRKGKILIEFTGTGKNRYKLKVSDNGVGISSGINLVNPDTLGLQLISSLVEQLDGKIKVDRKKGTIFTIVFSSN